MAYDFSPEVMINEMTDIYNGDKEIIKQLNEALLTKKHQILTIEGYPTLESDLLESAIVKELALDLLIDSRELFYHSQEVIKMIQSDLTEDRVFGKMSHRQMTDFIDPQQQIKLKEKIENALNKQLRVGIVGVGASLVYPPELLVYGDIPRWEVQKRYRSGNYSNWLVANQGSDSLGMIKQGYFFEWPVADRQKRQIYQSVDYFLDPLQAEWVMVSQETYDQSLVEITKQPFSLVPFFDPGVWGGHWMQEEFDFRKEEVNLAWSFNGVPEENSLILNFGTAKMEIPGNNLVYFHGKALLGQRVYGRFGPEFPIRFNLLDTMGGENLSLQVHPTTDYIQETFGAHYTQDESYYILQAQEDAKVYLGVKKGVEKAELMTALRAAADGEEPFADQEFIYQQKIEKHDHYSIPGGTIHSSGANSVVLEISATPNRYTFKLWDWGRLDLDGRPRPVHLDHGERTIDITRDEEWVKKELINPFVQLAEGEGWQEERTGLHETEFIETRRHTFSVPVIHDNHGSVNVLCLVEGKEATVESLDDCFKPFVLHYAQTVIMPETIKKYKISPSGPSIGQEIKTIKAYVR